MVPRRGVLTAMAVESQRVDLEAGLCFPK